MPTEDARRRIGAILERLREAYPNATTELRWSSPFELLIVTVLSAQTTDKKVNEVSPELFRRYPTPEALAQANPEELEPLLRPLGYFRQKARTIVNLACQLVERHGGEVPRSMEELTALPGVGRKTAAIVLGTAFGIREGIAVDTHVSRVSQRLGLTSHKTPDKIEQDLMALVPREDWTWFGHALVLHGRYVCLARRPRCSQCVLADLCPRIGVTVAA
ncbi:endonuclease III [Rhodothermus marinus SG0.5JP17-172]|jgi:endonuclease-3|uniref:endonuclease III n=1 Tax=Rhodothermus marinus TaxID=29549 RepID=UPI000223D8D3|nr:endonuclease III [Rhodothermus marinus]AEN73425.1 endonuclease III [Rhodothermus marinus SG0.5JP17-172]MBO2491280.1 endonuclease III [Rhodothermus marinus]